MTTQITIFLGSVAEEEFYLPFGKTLEGTENRIFINY